ncbi:helix-turn-helix domain-containing protein [Romboutsia hominis]|uniref:Helix-turn-helix domain n=1 Tax=Romboutsia hominis TaxID=1507512 RepID=A0A2P2BQG6_9FIRM|nr:helix-turn-helix transcriptional regulator [Romboutsia hominis]CEI72585.1 Helix-turn-helix domain [Romboutsia hominis]
MKLTEFGRFSRKLRIDNGELLKDMATKLDVTVSYLSAVEIGKRNIPEKWEEEIVRAYHLNLQEREDLKKAIIYSKKVFKINVENFEKEEKDLILMLARKVDNMDEKEKNNLKQILFK